MNTSSTTQKSGTLPLERKASPAQGAINNPSEQIEADRKVGWFDENFTGFDATSGSINFNLDTVVSQSVKSSMFANSSEWISIKPSAVADKVVSAASTVIKTAGDLAPDVKDAGIDLFNQITGKTEVSQVFQNAFKGEDSSKLDPNIKPDNKSEDLKNYSIIREAQAVLEKAQADYRGESMLDAALNPKRQEVADLAGLQGNYRDVLDKTTGETRTDLQGIVERARRERQEQALAVSNSIASPAKHGPEGPRLVNEDNKSGETRQTAQTAVG